MLTEENFSFGSSLQELAEKHGPACTCGRGKESPARHLGSCPVGAFYEGWRAMSAKIWSERLKHVPTRPPRRGEAVAEVLFGE